MAPVRNSTDLSTKFVPIHFLPPVAFCRRQLGALTWQWKVNCGGLVLDVVVGIFFVFLIFSTMNPDRALKQVTTTATVDQSFTIIRPSFYQPAVCNIQLKRCH
jgi:hypothetical protein